MKALLVLKDLQPNKPDKATYLANHKKTGLWPWTQLSASPCTVLFRWKSFLDHVDHATRRAPRRWTTARPRKGTTRQWKPARRGVRGFTGSAAVQGCRRRRAWPAVGIVGGGEASAAAQPATGGRSMRHDRRYFGRLEQQDHRLKKHYGR